MEPRLSFVTLCVLDLARARAFYVDTLGLEPAKEQADLIQFRLGSVMLALYPRTAMGAEACIDPVGSGFGGITLAHNLRTREEIPALLARAVAGGARELCPPTKRAWGGISAYFADPDGFVWELCFHPRLAIP